MSTSRATPSIAFRQSDPTYPIITLELTPSETQLTDEGGSTSLSLLPSITWAQTAIGLATTLYSQHRDEDEEVDPPASYVLSTDGALFRTEHPMRASQGDDEECWCMAHDPKETRHSGSAPGTSSSLFSAGEGNADDVQTVRDAFSFSTSRQEESGQIEEETGTSRHTVRGELVETDLGDDADDTVYISQVYPEAKLSLLGEPGSSVQIARSHNLPTKGLSTYKRGREENLRALIQAYGSTCVDDPDEVQKLLGLN